MDRGGNGEVGLSKLSQCYTSVGDLQTALERLRQNAFSEVSACDDNGRVRKAMAATELLNVSGRMLQEFIEGLCGSLYVIDRRWIDYGLYSMGVNVRQENDCFVFSGIGVAFLLEHYELAYRAQGGHFVERMASYREGLNLRIPIAKFCEVTGMAEPEPEPEEEMASGVDTAGTAKEFRSAVDL